MKSDAATPETSVGSPAWPRVSWIAALMLLTIGYRVWVAESDADHLWNTAPLMATCFGGGLLLGWRFCWVPALLLLVSDIFLGLSHDTGVGTYTLTSAVAYTAFACLGAAIGRGTLGKHWWVMVAGTLTSSVLFYVLGNTWAWLSMPEYAKSFAGWWQSQTVGLPGPWPPSLFFLRNALIGDTIWCLFATPLFFWKPVRSCQAGDESISAAAIAS
ncbi:MAG: hypothetical protein KDN19_09960 [Verrucomicrobiae bacterium]|nr:hypothetical protein [Verrucomicrobiae bacterium]